MLLHTAVQLYNAVFSEGTSNNMQTPIKSCTSAHFGTESQTINSILSQMFLNKLPN
jgi:hypothetical protein